MGHRSPDPVGMVRTLLGLIVDSMSLFLHILFWCVVIPLGFAVLLALFNLLLLVGFFLYALYAEVMKFLGLDK